jgi:HSP20 family protein
MKSMTEFGLPVLRRDFDRLFDDLWEASALTPREAEWMPKVDVSEANGIVLIRAECPGMDAKDVRLSIDDGVVTLEGEKRTEHEEKDERAFRRERRYGSFLRRIPLPMPVDSAKVKAEFKNGLLTVTLPKSPVAAEKRIPIQTG